MRLPVALCLAICLPSVGSGERGKASSQPSPNKARGDSKALLIAQLGEPQEMPLHAMRFAQRGGLLAWQEHGGKTWVWNEKKGQVFYCDVDGHSEDKILCFSPDSKLLLTCDAKHRLQVWEWAQQKCVRTMQLPRLPKNEGKVRLGASWEGSLVATATVTRTEDILAAPIEAHLCLWNTETGKETRCVDLLDHHPVPRELRRVGLNLDVEFQLSPNGRCLLVTTTYWNAIRDARFESRSFLFAIRDAKVDRELHVWKNEGANSAGSRWSRDGKTLVLANAKRIEAASRRVRQTDATDRMPPSIAIRLAAANRAFQALGRDASKLCPDCVISENFALTEDFRQFAIRGDDGTILVVGLHPT